jgi:hypothetical protein
MIRCLRQLAVCVFIAILAPALIAQSSPAPKRYPYRFSNFIWWTDADLRLALKQKIPNLGDTLVPFSAKEGEVRFALIDLLKTKGMDADVQVFDPPEQRTLPPNNPGLGIHAPKPVWPEPPQVSIAFTIAAPPTILVGNVSVEGAPPELLHSIQQVAQNFSGTPYGEYPHMTEFRLHTLFQSSAYLSASSTVLPGTPIQTSADHYLVPCTIKIDPGPAFHLGSISIDAGPLFAAADLSNYVLEQPGDVIVPHMLSPLVTTLRNTYLAAGYANVDVTADPVLDQQKALASYNIRVESGPLYHLRSLTVLNLDPAREQAVRDMLALKPGDVYNSLAPMSLFAKLHDNNPLLAGYTYGYRALPDEKEHLVDLTITFDPQR